MNPGRPHSSNLTALLLSIILLSFLTPALCFAKTAVDFNPNPIIPSTKPLQLSAASKT